MDELCPLCLKMGSNKRIKAVQINLEEAIWLCENEKCTWPFGSEAPNFLSRKVGEKRSDEWEVYRKVQKRVGPIPVSTELSLYTPPVTPSSDATIKESAKSNFSGNSDISEEINRIGDILRNKGTPDDSYAPKTAFYDKYTDDSEVFDSNFESGSIGRSENSGVVKTSVVLSSIFDIDGDELPSDEINEENSKNVTENNSKDVDAVLKNSRSNETPSEKLLEEHKETGTISPVQKNNSIKLKPQVRSISKTNINLPKKNCQKLAGMKKLNIEKSLEIERTDTLKKIECTNHSTEIDRTDKIMNTESTDSPERVRIADTSDELKISSNCQKLLNDTLNSKQCTTTIMVDGSFPIMLSYDPTDLEQKCNEIISTASTTNREEYNKNLSIRENVSDDKTMVSSTELPKKHIRSATKRRITSIGKQYEKFSFNALKKFVPASKGTDDDRRGSIDSSKNGVNEKLEKCRNINLEKSSTSSASFNNSLDNFEVPEVSNNLTEITASSTNINCSDSGITNDDNVVENLNFSGVLDDILMEGYQNATVNLNDDWLESFFT